MPSATSPDAAAAAGPWARWGAAGDLLRRTVAGGRVAPAYLFEGADPAAAREAARVFAAALLCRGESPPCLSCDVCRRVASGAHPDVHHQGRDKATVISVEALAALLERAHASPREGARQVFVVEPAEAMAPEAVARYLKTLEEPPPTTTFVLVTSRPDRLPETVRSRCQRIRFASPTQAEVERVLEAEGVPAERAARCARWATGSFARARRLAALEADLVVDALASAARPGGPGAATAAEAVLAALRRRAADVGPAEEGEGAGEAREGAAGEALRGALEDVLHALQVLARDRAAGLPGGALQASTPAAAAGALERLARLASLVRRNVSPSILLIEAASALAGS